jgi:hypothetical protein
MISLSEGREREREREGGRERALHADRSFRLVRV